MTGNTFTWIGGSGYATIASDWSYIGGTGSIPGPPNAGDTAIVTAGTVLMPIDATLSTNTIEIAGTAGTAAAIVFQGDGSITAANPTVDQATVIETLVQGQSAVGTSVLDTLGTFINQGTIEANGPAGSSFTIDVSQGTAGNPGVFINDGQMSVSTGNAMTIAVGPDAAFYNASDIQVSGGTLDITTTGVGQFDGGYAPLRGVVVIAQGGTVEDNIAYGTTVGGVAPYFAFADSAGNLLKLDQPAQFGGRILGFAAGDTIDLGTSLVVAGVSYDATTGILALDNAGGTAITSLAFVSGDFTTGSFAVSNGGADGFNFGTAGNGDLLLTTTATNEVWNSAAGGVFTTGSNWVGGTAPGTLSAVVIGAATGVTGTITTGGSSIAVQSLLFVGNRDTLVVSGSLGVGPGPLVQGGGTIEVTGGSTLGVTALSQVGGGALLLDSGALMTISGHPNFGYANNGSISLVPGAGYGVLLQGTALINAATLLSSASFNIGTDGSGTPAQVTVTAGGVVRDTFASLNSGPTSFGALTLSGTGTSWTDSGDSNNSLNPYGYMLVGYNDIGAPVPFSGAASLSVSNGATLTDAAYAVIALGPNSAGVANIGSGGVWNIGLANGGYLVVGAGGAAALDIAAGGSVAVGGKGTFVSNGLTSVSGGIGIGAAPRSSGAIDVAGGMLSTVAGIGIGEAGVGTLAITAAGTAEVTGNGVGIGIGQAISASGTVLVSAGLLSLGAATTGIGVGQAGTGLLAVESGGTVYIGAKGIGIGTSLSGSGTVTVSGGTIDVAGGGIAVGKYGSGVLSISDGGIVTIDSYNLYIGGSPSGPSPGAVGLVTLQSGTTGFGGVLDVADNAYVWAGSTLSANFGTSVDIGTSGNSGTFVSGTVVVEAGHSLIGNGTVSAGLVDNGVVLAVADTATVGQPLQIFGPISGSGTLVAGSGANLVLGGALAAGPTIDFAAGAPEGVYFTAATGTIANAITGFAAGDRIEFAGLYGQTASLSGSTLTVNGTIGNVATTYELTNVATAGAINTLLTGIDPYTGFGYVLAAGNGVWQWANNVSAAATIAADWTLVSGGTNAAGYPQPGDTAIIPYGTVVTPPDAAFISNTIELGGTTSVAALVLSGDTSVTWLNPSLDQNSLLETTISGQSSAAQSLLQISGRVVNQGQIYADGATGSSFTIDVSQGTSGVAGAFIDYGKMGVAAGNALTINVGTSAAFFNAGGVKIDGGLLDLIGTAGAIAGGLAPDSGAFLLNQGGTLEVNTGFPAGQTGGHPEIVFADTAGNLLKLDQPGQFGGRVIGFGQGDTIDLGTVTIGTLIYAGGVLSVENAGGTAIAALVISGESLTAGTYTVSSTSTIVGGFTLTGNGTDARLTASGTFDTWNGSTGTFTTAGSWSAGSAPGTIDTALISASGNTSYVVSTGTSAISVTGLIVADGNANLQVADSFSVTGAPVQALGGTIEVQAGGVLTAGALEQNKANASLLLDPGGTLDLLGRSSLGFANAGTLAGSPAGNFAMLVQGSAVVSGAVLNAVTSAAGTGGYIAVGAGGGGTGANMVAQTSTSSAGATVTDTYAYLSSDPTSFGSLTVSGTLTSWTDAGDPTDSATTRGYMVVGDNNVSTLVPYAGAANLLVTQSAILTEANYALIGASADSAGTATVSNLAQWNIGTGAGTGFLDVGMHGQGSLLVTNSGTQSQGGTVAVGSGGTIVNQGVTQVVGTAVDIGVSAGGTGVVTVTGGAVLGAIPSQEISSALPRPRGSQLLAAGNMVVGDAGQGTLDVLNGGLVAASSGNITIGNQAGGTGFVQVDGPGSDLQAPAGTLIVGQGGSGSLLVTNFASASADTVVVNNSASLDNNATIAAATALTVAAAGRIVGSNQASLDTPGATTTVTDLGTIEARTGYLGISGALAGSGVVQIDSGAALVVDGSIASSADSFVFMSGTAGTPLLDLVSPGSVLANPIVNLQGGDQIALENFSAITNAALSGGSLSNGALTGATITVTGTLTSIGKVGSMTLTDVSLAPGAQTSFSVVSSGLFDPYNSNPSAPAIQLACFAAGTRLATAHGAAPVERLAAGDVVRTAGGALRKVRWIGFRTIDLLRHPDPRRAQPIRVCADAFADGVPARDLLLSPDHAVFDRGRLIPVRLLVNDATIRRETGRRRITYYHVELDSHDLLLAEGLAAESYLDTGNRGIFENAAEPLILHPDFLDPAAQQRHRLAASCAPVTDAPAEVEPLWWRLADRAHALGFALPAPALTEDPALSVRIGGRRLRPVAREGATYRFALPAGAAMLVSRSAYPSDARPWIEDRRRLGVMIRRLALERGGVARALPLDDPGLGRGWWAPETDGVAQWRWTDGTAALPVQDAPAELVVELAGTVPYPLPAAGPRRRALA